MDETPKGWYIQYIDRDPETIRRQLELEKKKKQDLDDEEKTAKFIEEQVRRGLEGKEQVGTILLREAIERSKIACFVKYFVKYCIEFCRYCALSRRRKIMMSLKAQILELRLNSQSYVIV